MKKYTQKIRKLLDKIEKYEAMLDSDLTSDGYVDTRDLFYKISVVADDALWDDRYHLGCRHWPNCREEGCGE